MGIQEQRLPGSLSSKNVAYFLVLALNEESLAAIKLKMASIAKLPLSSFGKFR